MKKIIILIVIVLVIGFFWFKGDKTPNPDTTGDSLPSPTATNPDQMEEGTITTPAAPNVKSFIVVGSNFSFSLKTIEVNQGDTVKITFQNADGFHDWKLDEFTGATTKQLKAGESETIEFVADKAGAFEYYCSVGNHRAMGMKGTLTVK